MVVGRRREGGGRGGGGGVECEVGGGGGGGRGGRRRGGKGGGKTGSGPQPSAPGQSQAGATTGNPSKEAMELLPHANGGVGAVASPIK